MPGIALGNFVTSITKERFFPKVVDNIYEGNALFERLRGKARPWTGGYRLTIPTTVSERTALGSFSGFDTFSTNQEDVRKQFTINPSEYYATITISGIQKALNRGPEAVVDLLTAEFEDVGRALSEKMGEHCYLDGKQFTCAVIKFGEMLETLVKSFVLYIKVTIKRIESISRYSCSLTNSMGMVS